MLGSLIKESNYFKAGVFGIAIILSLTIFVAMLAGITEKTSDKNSEVKISFSENGSFNKSFSSQILKEDVLSGSPVTINLESADEGSAGMFMRCTITCEETGNTR